MFANANVNKRRVLEEIDDDVRDEIDNTIKRVRREVVLERRLKRALSEDSTSDEEDKVQLCPKRHRKCIKERVEEKVARVLDRFATTVGVPEELVEAKISMAVKESLEDMEQRLGPELRKLESTKRRREDTAEQGTATTQLALEEEVAALKAEKQTLEGLLEATRAEKRAEAYAGHQKSAEALRWQALWKDEHQMREALEARLLYDNKVPGRMLASFPTFIH